MSAATPGAGLVAMEDFRIDYEMFSQTLPDRYFPRGANWLMLGPSGPRRLRLAVEHLCQHRGGICFLGPMFSRTPRISTWKSSILLPEKTVRPRP